MNEFEIDIDLESLSRAQPFQCHLNYSTRRTL